MKIYRTDRTVEEPSEVPPFREMQKIVGGYVEFVYLLDGTVMVVNENGIPEGLALNQTATDIAGTLLYGNIIHLSAVEFKENIE